MISNNGFCCYLFKGTMCELDDTQTDYETFSNSVGDAGISLLFEATVIRYLRPPEEKQEEKEEEEGDEERKRKKYSD